MGIDPINLRDTERQDAVWILQLLYEVALDAFERRGADLKGDGKAGRWFSPLELHILPKLGKLSAAALIHRDIRNALAPIWHDKRETARKAISRASIAIQHFVALARHVDLQAVDKARTLFGTSRHETTHIPSIPWQDVPAFYSSLDELKVTHLALRLLILTGLRSRPIRHSSFDQSHDATWKIPGEIMKGKLGRTPDFNLPLSEDMLKVIDLAKSFLRDGYLFSSVRTGVIRDATMSRMMERRGMKERPHGFRASLRTWLSDATSAPHEVAEMALAHAADSKVVRTYCQIDFFEQRARLMERWPDHVTGRSGKIFKLAGAL